MRRIVIAVDEHHQRRGAAVQLPHQHQLDAADGTDSDRSQRYRADGRGPTRRRRTPATSPAHGRPTPSGRRPPARRHLERASRPPAPSPATRSTPAGASSRCRSPCRTARSPVGRRVAVPAEQRPRPADQLLRAAALNQEADRGAEREHRRDLRRHGHQRRLHPVAAVRHRPGPPVTRARLPTSWPSARSPAAATRPSSPQFMGLPISVHVRGPQARPTGSPTAGQASVRPRCAADDADVQHLPPDSRGQPDPPRRAAAATTPARGSAASPPCATRRTTRTDGAFSRLAPRRRRPARLRPDRPGQGLGGGAGLRCGCSAGLRTPRPRTTLLISAGGDIAVACARTDTPDWIVGDRGPAGPDPDAADRAAAHAVPSPRPAPPPGHPHHRPGDRRRAAALLPRPSSARA